MFCFFFKFNFFSAAQREREGGGGCVLVCVCVCVSVFECVWMYVHPFVWQSVCIYVVTLFNSDCDSSVACPLIAD